MDPSLAAAWFAVTAGLVKLGETFDRWMLEAERTRVSLNLRASLADHPTGWIRAINESFFILFDALYKTRYTRFDRLVWRGIVGAYAILILARTVLWVFEIPPPATELILITALVIVVATGLLSNAVYRIIDISSAPTALLVDAPGVRLWISMSGLMAAGSAALAFALMIIAATALGDHMGAGPKMIAAYGLGVVLATIALLLVYLIPDKMFPISPIRSLVSSIVAVVFVGLCFRDASATAISSLMAGQWQICTFVCFNVFADAISVLETRWILKRTAQCSMGTILGFVVVDLALSGMAFLVLPGIADQDPMALFEAIWFRGPQPWLGVLFWSTLATSALFYAFVAAALLIRILTPVFALIRPLDSWFSIYDHPVRLITMALIVVESAIFIALAAMR